MFDLHPFSIDLLPLPCSSNVALATHHCAVRFNRPTCRSPSTIVVDLHLLPTSNRPVSSSDANYVSVVHIFLPGVSTLSLSLSLPTPFSLTIISSLPFYKKNISCFSLALE